MAAPKIKRCQKKGMKIYFCHPTFLCFEERVIDCVPKPWRGGFFKKRYWKYLKFSDSRPIFNPDFS